MKTLNLLILDDEQCNIDNYKSDIKIFNLTNHDYHFEIHSSNTAEEAKKILDSKEIHYAILDINLQSNPTPNPGSGNDVISYIKDKYKIPSAIISGFVNDLSDSIKNSMFIKIITRGEVGTNKVLEDFCAIEKSNILNVFSNNGLLNKIIKEAFWEHIATGLEFDDKLSIDSNSLLRFISNYIKETLSYKDGVDLDYHPFEFYIIPSITKDNIQTGSLIKYNDKNYIVLTPACDIANDKNPYFQIVEIDSIDCLDAIKKAKENIAATIKQKESPIKSALHNNIGERYHFLPPHKLFPGGLINFQKVQSIEQDTIKKNSEIIGNVTSEFLKDISARFSMYYSRQGQPCLTDLEYICKYIYD